MIKFLSTITLLVSFLFSISQATASIIGSTEVPLNGSILDIRSVETNLGNLVADSMYWQASESGLNPTIAFTNGGGLRNNSIIPAGDIDSSVIDAIAPFGNEVVMIKDVSVSDLRLALENSVFAVDSLSGRFLQVSGFRFSWETLGVAGNRIIDVFLNDGTALVDDGTIVSGLLLNIATNSFVADGGDSYSMFPGAYTKAGTGILYDVALSNYIQRGLGGIISADDYPEGGEGRIIRDGQIVFVSAPATLALFGLGLAGLRWSRRKKV